jgi:replicative DNA helicase
MSVSPFGVGPLDDLIQSGVRDAQSYLILGPPGAGKTTLTVDWSVDRASKHRIYYASYDRGLAKELTFRVLGPMCGIGESNLSSGRSAKDLTIMSAGEKSTCAQNWEVHDYASTPQREANVSALLQDVREEHEKNPIGMVVIDPLWPLILNTAASKGVPMYPATLQVEVRAMVEQLNSLCGELGLVLVATHELSAEDTTGPVDLLTARSSKEVRTLANRLRHVILIRKHPGARRSLVLVKGRNLGTGQAVRAYLNRDMNVFTCSPRPRRWGPDGPEGQN